MGSKTELVAYCGMYCGECPAYTQSIANLAGNLRQELRRNKCEKIAPALARIPAFKAFRHYQKAYDLLGAMMKFRCGKPCRSGGGDAQCKIRKCAKQKSLAGCWECDDFAACKKLKSLVEFGDVDKTYLKKLRKLKRIGPAAFVKQRSAARR
jgi:hypothetical protein